MTIQLQKVQFTYDNTSEKMHYTYDNTTAKSAIYV